MDFTEIERTVVDFFERHDATVEQRGCEWFLVDEQENTISLTSLAAALVRLSRGEKP